MADVIRWYVVVQIMGLAGLPLTIWFFRHLPDRGYAFARPVGMLVVAVALWFGALFGLWPNTGAMVAILVVALAAAGWLGLRQSVNQIRALWRDNRGHVYVIEGLFLLAFIFWAVCRSYFPDIAATEKPMEFAFLNGIIRSHRFPPVDPWLSGNSISYYYLGYVMVAALTELSGVLPAVAFNLALATLFALTATGAFAVTHALVDGLRRTRRMAAGESEENVRRWPSWLAGGVGTLFAVLLGNWEGFLEMLHAHGVGSSAFWQWFTVVGLSHPFISTQWYPTDAQDNWWWFRASRVVTDYPFGGALPKSYNTINEFPFFSFLLGDVHPHVLALPFAFVCLGFSLSFLRSTDGFEVSRWRDHLPTLGFIAFLYGAMFLLNAWDILTYLFVLMCTFAVRSYLSRPAFDFEWFKRSVVFGVMALVISVVVYWPFYMTFRSQASGLLGVVQLHTHLRQFILFWGPFLFIAGSLVISELAFGTTPLPSTAWRSVGPRWTRSPVTWGATAVVAVACYVVHAPALTIMIPMLVAALALVLNYLEGSVSLVTYPAKAASGRAVDEDVSEGATPRAGDHWPSGIAGGAVPASIAAEHLFVLVLLFTAALLLVGTDLVYIQDLFGNRMNTVFKLYYQSWVMLSIVCAYAVFYFGSCAFGRELSKRTEKHVHAVWVQVRPLAARSWLAVVGVMVAAAFIYVPASIESRSQGFTSHSTLNGLAYYQQYHPNDAAGIRWLNEHVKGTPTIVEATGGSYSAFDEVSWMTGLPTILGWDFHEVQWRGDSIIPVENQRKNDINTIYQTADPTVAQELLAKYHAEYVYVGPLERQAYPNDAVGLEKFGTFMNVVYRNPGVVIYQVRGGS